MKNETCSSLSYRTLKCGFLSAALLLAALPFSGQAADGNLIANGDFETGTDWPEGWGRPKAGGTLEKEGNNHFVRLVAPTPGEETTLYLAYNIEANKAYELTYRVKVDNLKPGKELWFDARIITNIKDESGESFPGPEPIYFRKDTGKWLEKSVKFKTPENATKLEIIAGLFRVDAGTFEIDDLVLKEIDPKSVK